MQGTIVMMMALSGLGCHHKSCAPVAPACYDSCYSSCYSAPVVADCGTCGPTSYVAPACYSSCYGSCYSGGYATGAE